MLNSKWLGVLVLSTLAIAGVSQAEEKTRDTAKNASVEAAVQAGLHRVNESLTVETASKTPVDGVYLVQMGTGELLYVTGNGKYVFTGDLMEIQDGGLDNLTEKVREGQVRERLAAVDPADAIVFQAKGERKAIMYVFTDVDCGYCRKLHQEVPELNEKGVEVRYLAFPRGGEQAPAFAKMVSAWCATDRQTAMTALKSGSSIPTLTCDNPVMSQYQLGVSLGVRGTPAIYLEDGRSVPGYQPASSLLKLMGL